mmetsp:Transcript_69357/g.224238  ORF Transcript_69357/g.224238 Transcript_69357/m.224238 type:complete len:201 (+) Transcript_69357:1191-1793(+)
MGPGALLPGQPRCLAPHRPRPQLRRAPALLREPGQGRPAGTRRVAAGLPGLPRCPAPLRPRPRLRQAPAPLREPGQGRPAGPRSVATGLAAPGSEAVGGQPVRLSVLGPKPTRSHPLPAPHRARCGSRCCKYPHFSAGPLAIPNPVVPGWVAHLLAPNLHETAAQRPGITVLQTGSWKTHLCTAPSHTRGKQHTFRPALG